MRSYLLLAACLLCLAATKARADTINMSQDLVRLGIATQNLAPDDPAQDARPLVQATLEYAQSHGTVSLVTLDPGDYYFFTPQNQSAYCSVSNLSNCTIDFAGSTIYFADPFFMGFFLQECQNVTLTNVTIDFLMPPYTYVELVKANPTARTLTYKTLPDCPDPATLTAPEEASVVLWALAFRNGDMVPGTSRMKVAQPITGNVLALVQDDATWTQSATLATLRPGDIIAVTQRGSGQQPVRVLGGDAITISHATIHGGSSMAVLLEMVSNATVDHVRVIPRPGNLTSTNADGIHYIDSGPNNHILNCQVVRSLDDALVMDSLDIALVPTATPSGATRIDVLYSTGIRFQNGTFVNFIDPESCQELTGATIVAQEALPDGKVRITFDQPLPALAADCGMTFASPQQRGAGSSIEGNRAEDILFGRGIWIGGSVGVTIQNNTVGTTSDGGIVVYQSQNSNYPTPPARDITIQYNRVKGSLGPMASGGCTSMALGGIMVDSVNQHDHFVSSSPNANISIQYNRVLSSGRTGIWVGQLHDGMVSHNTITGYGLYPNLPLFGIPNDEIPQLLQDFRQAIVCHDCQDVSLIDNIIIPKVTKSLPALLFLLDN